MKKLFFFFFFILGFINGWGQNTYNIARHRNVDVPTNIISINSKSYFAEMIGTCCQDSMNIAGLNDAGTTILKKKLNFSGFYWNTPKKILMTKDSCLLLFGRLNNSCDVIQYTDFLTKCDTAGTTVFQTTIAPSGGNYSNLLSDVTEYSDSSFYLIPKNGSYIYHYSKSGQFIGSMNTLFNGMNAITTLANGNLLINGKTGGVLKNVELALNNTIIYQQNTTEVVKKYIESSNKIYSLDSSGMITCFNSSLITIANTAGSLGMNRKVNDFFIRNDSVYCVGVIYPSNAAFYAVLSSSLSLIHLPAAILKRVNPSGVTINNKQNVKVITNGSSFVNTEMVFTGLFHFPKNGNFQSQSDIGVIGFSMLTGSLYNYIGTGYVPHVDLKVKVKNYTADTVKSFYLNHYSSLMWCPQLLHKKYSNLILPFDTVEVSTGMFYGKYEYQPGGILPGNIYKRQICINSSVPNFKNDKEINNDHFCDTLSFLVPVGIKELVSNEVQLDVYPVPFKEKVAVNLERKMESLKVLDLIGRIIFANEVNEKTQVIDLSKLEKGIYFVVVRSEGRELIRKIIKE